MNKFFAIVCLAVACQVASSNPVEVHDMIYEGAFSMAAASLDDRETSLLIGDERIFSDFCHEQRQYVANDVKNTANAASADLFRLFFSSASEINDAVMNVQREAVEQLGKQIQMPDTPIEDSPIPENQVVALIEEGKRAIQAQGGVAGASTGAFTVVEAVLAAAKSALFTRFAQLRSLVNGKSLISLVFNNCDKIAEYQSRIEEELESTKQTIEASKPDMQNFLKTITVNSLHCQTTKNVARLNSFCSLFKAGRGPFLKMLGISNAN